MASGEQSTIEAIRMRRPLEAAAIAKMTPDERARLARIIGDAMAHRDNRRDAARIALALLAGAALLGGLMLYAG